MRFNVLSLSLLGLAAATPTSSGNGNDYGSGNVDNGAGSSGNGAGYSNAYGKMYLTRSTGFRLYVKPEGTPYDYKYLASAHLSPGFDFIDATDRNSSRVFYQNGTQEEFNSGRSTVLSDGGQPPFPSGLSVVNDVNSTDVSTVYLIAGHGTEGISVQNGATLMPGNYLVCDESVSYYQGEHFSILKYSESDDVPDECTRVCLVAECAKLNDLPYGSISSHDHALLTECYVNVGETY